MKSSVQWSPIQSWPEFHSQWDLNLGPCYPKSGLLTTPGFNVRLLSQSWTAYIQEINTCQSQGQHRVLEYMLLNSQDIFASLLKRGLFYKKIVCSQRSKFFSCRVGPFFERGWCAEKFTGSYKNNFSLYILTSIALTLMANLKWFSSPYEILPITPAKKVFKEHFLFYHKKLYFVCTLNIPLLDRR